MPHSLYANHLVLLLRHLAAALEAQMPMHTVPDLLAQDSALPRRHRSAYVRLAHQLKDGTSLGQALQSMDKTFGTATVEWLDGATDAPERARALKALATDLQLQQHGHTRLRLALIWPIFLTFSICMMFAVMAIFVAPALRDAFEYFGEPLPPLTASVFSPNSANGMAIGWQPGLLLGLFLLGLLLTYTRPQTRHHVVRVAYAVGLMRRTEAAALTARTLALMANTPAVIAPPAVTHLAGSGVAKPLQKKILALATALASKQTWSQALQTSGALAPHFALHLALGERCQSTNELLNTLQQQAMDEWEDALARLERNMVGLIYIALASLVTTLAAAIYLPIFKLGQIV